MDLASKNSSEDPRHGFQKFRNEVSRIHGRGPGFLFGSLSVEIFYLREHVLIQFFLLNANISQCIRSTMSWGVWNFEQERVSFGCILGFQFMRFWRWLL